MKLVANHMFNRMLTSARKQGHGMNEVEDCVIVAFDPGETTGLCYYLPWEPGFSIHLAQIKTPNVEQGYEALSAALPQTTYPQIWVCEDYKVYGWKADDHKWASLHTPQLIGAIRLMAHVRKIPIVFQMAGQAKNFAKDELLKQWYLYSPEGAMRHARDASRHLVNYTFFGKLPTWPT